MSETGTNNSAALFHVVFLSRGGSADVFIDEEHVLHDIVRGKRRHHRYFSRCDTLCWRDFDRD